MEIIPKIIAITLTAHDLTVGIPIIRPPECSICGKKLPSPFRLYISPDGDQFARCNEHAKPKVIRVILADGKEVDYESVKIHIDPPSDREARP